MYGDSFSLDWRPQFIIFFTLYAFLTASAPFYTTVCPGPNQSPASFASLIGQMCPGIRPKFSVRLHTSSWLQGCPRWVAMVANTDKMAHIRNIAQHRWLRYHAAVWQRLDHIIATNEPLQSLFDSTLTSPCLVRFWRALRCDRWIRTDPNEPHRGGKQTPVQAQPN